MADIRILALQKKFSGGFPQLSFYTRLQFHAIFSGKWLQKGFFGWFPSSPNCFSLYTCVSQLHAIFRSKWLRQSRFLGGFPAVLLFISIYRYKIYIYVSHFHTIFRDKWLVLENKFFGEFPRLLFYTDVSQSPALLSNRAVASEKVLCRVLAVRCLCLRVGCLGHPTVLLYTCLRVSYHLLRQMTGASERFFGGFPDFSLLSLHSQFPAIVWDKELLLQKRFSEGSPNCSRVP